MASLQVDFTKEEIASSGYLMILFYLLEENSLVLIIVLYKEFGSMHQITGSFQAFVGAKGLRHKDLTKAMYYTNAPSETSFHKGLSRPMYYTKHVI